MPRFAILALAAVLLLPLPALAKRAGPPQVEPVVRQGIRYTAPNDDGRRGYIEASRVSTGQKLWDLTVYTNPIAPKLEEDVQWVFIKALRFRAGRLFVTTERGGRYRVLLKTRVVRELQAPER